MTTCVEAGVHYLTRLSRYEILESALVTEHLSSASWTEVEDALSGPKRQATELGLLTLSAGRRVVRDNGEPYEPIETRVVIARSALEGDGDKRGTGIAKDGWWYELFATDLPVAPWPAAEVVSFYYGRSGQENRFHQEDRELGLDRIFSCHLPGQHLASLVGLFIWNLRIARGAELQGPLPDKLPQQPPRVPVSVPPSRLPNAAEAAQPSPHTATSTSIPPRNATTSAEGSACCPGAPAAPPPDEPQASDAPAAAPPTSVQDLSPATSVPTCISAPLEPSALGALGWSEQLERLPRWHWDPLHGLVCPNDAPLRLHGVSTATDGSLLVRWRARVSACRDCPERMGCTSSPSPEFRKELWFSFGPEAFTTVAGLATIAKPAPAVHSAAVVAGNSSGANTPWRPTPADDPAGVLAVLAVSWPVLLPSVLRHAFREACGEILVEVKLRNAGPPRRVLPRYYAAGVAERQQRRRSWTWRCQRNELPAAAEVDITLHGGRAVAKLLEPTEKAHAAA
jgi:hypothetical protein